MRSETTPLEARGETTCSTYLRFGKVFHYTQRWKKKGMTLFFIYLSTELNYLSNDIILCGFVVVVYTLYRWTSQI